MPEVKRYVLDVLKPHEPDMLALAEGVAECAGVDGVNALLMEVDEEVQNVKLTVEGDAVVTDAVDDAVESQGGSIHSIDQVACGEVLIEDSPTPQDR
ncbi:MAG: DUF211 domain-containing protein [Haloarculaceae archaeon]